MTALTLALCFLAALFGLACSLAAWLVLRLWVGGFGALLGFTAIIVVTCFYVVEIMQAGA